MNDAIRPQPGIMDIALYQGGKSNVAGVSNVVKLSSNENPFGPLDKAKDAFAKSVHQLHRYPSTDHASLRGAIAEVHGLDADRIICGVGSDEIIHFLCQAYAGPGDEVLYTEHGYEELYDTVKDPHETVNLAKRGSEKARLEKLRKRYEELKKKVK